MATRTFTLNTSPHEAVIGNTVLFLQPEVDGATFVEAYAGLRDAQAKVTGTKASSTKHAKAVDTDPETLRELSAAMRGFIRRFLLEDSTGPFDALSLPDRILVQLVEYLAEIYGGGSGNRDADGGTSTD